MPKIRFVTSPFKKSADTLLHPSVTKNKILHVIATLDPAHGGPVQGLRNYIPEFHSRGMKNEVLCLDDPAALFLRESVFPIVHALGPCKRPWAYAARLMPWLERHLLDYDVIIIHGLWLYHGYAITKAVSRFRKKEKNQSGIPKVFVMCHGMLDPYFQNAPERRLKAIRNNIYWNLIESKVLNRAQGILFTCEEELILARQTFKSYQPKKEINVGYGIKEPPPFSQKMQETFLEKCKAVAGNKFLLFLGRIHQKKGIDLLINAFKEIYIDGPLPNDDKSRTCLLIAGPGLDTTYGHSLQQMVSDAGIEQSVFFTGMLRGDEKWGAFYNCEAFVLPSHQENFGIAIAEALACAKPVLISNKVNIWREIDAAMCGLVEEDTQQGTSLLLSKWVQMNDADKLTMQQNAVQCYETNFAVIPAVTRLAIALSEN